MATFSITLPEALRSFAEREVAERGLSEIAEYLVQLVREAEARQELDEERLERLLLQGSDSPRHEFDEAFRARLDAKVEEILRPRTSRA